MADPTALLNGVDVRTQTGCKAVGTMSSLLHCPGTLRGSNEPIPGDHGEPGADLPLDAYNGDITLQISGSTADQLYANLAAFMSAIRLGTLSSLCTLERQLPKTGGGVTSMTSPKGGQIAGSPFTNLNYTIGRAVLTIRQLSGYWFDPMTSTKHVD